MAKKGDYGANLHMQNHHHDQHHPEMKGSRCKGPLAVSSKANGRGYKQTYNFNGKCKKADSIAIPTNSIANGTNSIAKTCTNSIAIPTNSIANGTNSIAKATNSIAKTMHQSIDVMIICADLRQPWTLLYSNWADI